jgi:hypothetical protein
MKTLAKLLAVLFVIGLFGASCATLDRRNSEFEEEMTRIDNMTPQQKADWEKGQQEEYE